MGGWVGWGNFFWGLGAFFRGRLLSADSADIRRLPQTFTPFALPIRGATAFCGLVGDEHGFSLRESGRNSSHERTIEARCNEVRN